MTEAELKAQRKYISTHRETINEKRRAWEKKKRQEDPLWKEKRQKLNNSRTAKWLSKNREKMKLIKRRSILKTKYGITLEEYQNLLKEQENKCAICKREEVQLCIDHDHVTGKTRGLLCHACNRAIGLLKENEQILINAINYVNRYKT